MPNLSVVSKIMKYFQSQTKLGHFHISSCLAALWDLERKKKHKSQFKAWVVALIVFQIQPELERTGAPLGETCSQETSVKFWACSSRVSALFIELPERYQTYSGPLSNIQFHLGNNFLISPAILCGTLKELGPTLLDFLLHIHMHDVRLDGSAIMQIMTA